MAGQRAETDGRVMIWQGAWPLRILGLAFLAQAVILSAIRTGTSYDGAEQLLYSQYVALGYGRSQPPLYT